MPKTPDIYRINLSFCLWMGTNQIRKKIVVFFIGKFYCVRELWPWPQFTGTVALYQELIYGKKINTLIYRKRKYKDVEGHEEVDGNSKNRASREITELNYFVLVLVLNQVTTKYDGLRAEEQAAKIVKLSLEWTDLLRTDFGMINIKLMRKGGVTEKQLRATINKDTGKNMLKKLFLL